MPRHAIHRFLICPLATPENRLNATSTAQYAKNICTFVRQWHYSPTDTAKSVDVVLMVNGIPLAAIELKDENKGQTVTQAMTQWMKQRNPKELAFRHNRRVLAFFAVDLNNVYMTTELKEGKTRFLPFNRGSNGPGNDGGAGNPPWTGKGLGPKAQTAASLLKEFASLVTIPNAGGRYSTRILPEPEQIGRLRQKAGELLDGKD